MGFFDDERGVSVQVGAVVLLAFVVIAISTYQVQVVPSQNEEVEVNHNREVQERMQDLRDTVGTVPARGVGGSVAVPLGTRYPARSIFVNPPPPAGLLRTVGTTNDSVGFTVDNASALDGETADYWNGTARSFSTGAIVYVPRYNVYQGAPTTVYENSLAYNRFRTANITLTRQDVFDGDRITLTALDGEVRREGGTASLTVRAVTSDPRTVTVEGNASDPVTVTVPTTLSAGEWRDLLNESGQYDPAASDPDANVTAVRPNRTLSTDGPVPLRLVTFELEPGTYRLRLAKAGVGTGVTAVRGGTYLTAEGPTTRSVPAGGSETLTVAVSDRYNSLRSGVLVNASVSGGGAISDTDRRTGDDGRVSFVYDAPPSPGSATVNMTISAGTNASERVTYDVTVTAGGGNGGGNGAYNVTWRNPANGTASGAATVACSQAPPRGQCTIQGNGESQVTLPMVMFTDPTAVNTNVSYAVSNGTVGSFSPTTGTTNGTGEDSTTLTVDTNGTVTTYVTGGAGGDRVEFTVAGLASGSSMFAVYVDANDNSLLRTTDTSGNLADFGDNPGASVLYVGTRADLDDDGDVEIPYVDGGGSGQLRFMNSDGSYQQLANGVATGGSLGVDDASNAVYYITSGGDLHRVAVGGADTAVTYTTGNNGNGNTRTASGVGAVGYADANGDGDQDPIYLEDSTTIAYIDDTNRNSVALATGAVGQGNGYAIGRPTDFGSGVRVPIVNGNQDIALVNPDTGATNTIYSGGGPTPAQAPLAVLDWDGDGQDEILFVASDGSIVELDESGGSWTATPITGAGEGTTGGGVG